MTTPGMSPSERLLRLAHAGPVANPRDVIWAPDEFPLELVAASAESVLCDPGALSRDVAQASYLITTFLRLSQYVAPAQETEQ